jgi:hypothetical protein
VRRRPRRSAPPSRRSPPACGSARKSERPAIAPTKPGTCASR